MTVLSKIDTIILHVPKTGGSSVRWAVMNKFGVRYSCQHCDYKMLPKQYRNFRKITFIRNPIDWYASRFYFDKKKFDTNKRAMLEPFTDALSEKYSKTFKETLPRMLDLTEAFKNERVLDLFKKSINREVTNNYQCWWVSYFDDIDTITAESFEHKSLYQWFCDKIDIEQCDAIYRLEDQHSLGMKKEFGGDVDIKHKNKTGRRKSSDIYSSDMVNKVIEKEKDFISRYGYEEIIKEVTNGRI